MHGFFGSYNQKVNWDLSSFPASFVVRKHDEEKLHLTQVSLPKFLSDKYFAEADDCFIATEGVLFEADNPVEAIARYRKGETVFWDSWRGSFAGVLYDKKTDTLLLFNDQTGSKMLFYTQTENGFCFASDLLVLARTLGAKTPDKTFIQAILEQGYSSGNRTFVNGIQRLTAGQYIRVSGKNVEITDYHRFSNTPYAYNESEMIAETDRLFRQAVERVIRKNEQAHLRHFFPLSGGLDSRMSQWIARQIATQPIVNYTYSQSGHYDHLLPKEISQTLGNKWQFMPLDGGNYITNVDEVCRCTEWLVNYMAPVEIAHFTQQQAWEQIGVVLTGINGDNILATETDNSHEMARIYDLGFNGNSLGSPLVLQHVTESYSPFCDVDLLDYVLHIPTDKRRNYYFYDRWILTCYPEAAQWHHKHEQIGKRHKMVTLAGRNIRLTEVPKRLAMYALKRLHIYDAYRAQGDSMNPYDDWAKANPKLAETLNNYFEAHKHLLTDQTLAAVCEHQMRIGSIMEKGKILTILSALKAFADTCEPAK